MSDSWKECEGQVVDDKFKLLEHLGGSNHSVVFLTARGQGNSQKAAIKFVQADAANADLQLSRWKQAAQLSHPNLLGLFESGRCQMAGMDLLYVVTEFAAENLAEFLPQRALSAAETRDMLEPFLETLTYLHGKGLLHGRIKPGNILAIDDQLKLSSDSICRAGETLIGSSKPDAHTPPESAEGDSSASGDVWALGVTLVEALTQRAPERSSSQSSSSEGELPVPDSVPQPFLDIARQCLQLNPRNRWSVGEISARLNPPAKPPAPSVSATSVPDPIKPAAVRLPSSVHAPAVAAPPRPRASVDPLSVPLSSVPPLPPKALALQNQMIPRKSAPTGGYYAIVTILVVLTLGAILAIPRIRSSQPEAAPVASAPPSQPAETSSAPPAPTNVQPLVPAKPAKSQKQPAPAAQRSVDRAALQPAQPSPQVQSTSERELIKKDQPSSSPAAAPASSDVPGEALNQVLPDVSSRSRSTIRGTVRVVVKVHVDSTGAVTGADVASSPSRFFGDAALHAARRWDFAPAKAGGQYVASDWLVRFDFTSAGTTVFPAQTSP